MRRRQQETQQRLSQVVDAIDDCYWSFDLSSQRFHYVSPAFERILGVPIETAYRDPASLWRGLAPEEQLRLRQQALSPLPGEMEISWNWPDGRSRRLRLRARRLDQGLVGILQDVTQLREAQTSQAHGQKMEALGRLAGGVAHDLNNLLTVILGYGQSLREELPQNEELTEILQAVDRATGMTGQLLTLSRRQVMQPKQLDLNAVLRDMHGVLRSLLPANIELDLQLSEPLPLVALDLAQWEQVVLNLVIHAREAQPGGGLIGIATSHAQGWVHFELSHQGPRLAPAVQEQIFEPFSDRQQGTGLGLAPVYGIVTQSGGRIWVESPAQEGSKFVVALPVSNGKPSLPEEIPAAVPSGPPRPPRVLVVDDNDAIRRLVVTLLRREGYEVMEAGSGEQALQASSIPVELLVTDFAMPGMSGVELAEKLSPAKVLFTSGCSLGELEQKGFHAEKASFLPKPFSPLQLREKVHSLLD